MCASIDQGRGNSGFPENLAFTPKQFAVLYSGDFSSLTLRPTSPYEQNNSFTLSFNKRPENLMESFRKLLIAFDDSFQIYFKGFANQQFGRPAKDFNSVTRSALQEAAGRIGILDNLVIKEN